jgi:hypothetical protein
MMLMTTTKTITTSAIHAIIRHQLRTLWAVRIFQKEPFLIPQTTSHIRRYLQRLFNRPLQILENVSFQHQMYVVFICTLDRTSHTHFCLWIFGVDSKKNINSRPYEVNNFFQQSLPKYKTLLLLDMHSNMV